jgi:hypothetical protein
MAKTPTPQPLMWFRRIVPPGYQEATLVLQGGSPLLMHSADYDRDGETYRAYYLLGKKRGKSLDDEQRLRELEWTLSIYFDDQLGPYIPGKNVKELLRSAATNWRKGEEVKRSLAILDYRIPLLYDGPRDTNELWEAGFKYQTMVSNSGPGSGRVVRCRPMFERWSLVVEIAYDPECIDFDLLQLIVERSKRYGLGDYRPERGGDFGIFEAELTAGDLHKASTNGLASKPVIRDLLLAHQAFVRLIVGGEPAEVTA